MNTLQSYLLRAIATLILIAIPLASCSRADDSSLPAIAPEATGEVEILPTPAEMQTIEMQTAEVVTPSALSTATTVTTQTITAETITTEIVTTETVVSEVTGGDLAWVQESYGEAWSIGYPASWQINDAGAHAGSLTVQGDYNNHHYTVTYDYPIGIFADTLEAWVAEILLPLTLEQREAVVTNDIAVANTPAKKVLNMPTDNGTSIAHHVYIWRTDTQNWRLVTITQSDNQPVDTVAMDQLLDQLLLRVQ